MVLGDADLVLLTVPDDVLPGLVAGLAATGAPYAGRLVAHASGAHGTGVLDPATRAGALPLALHPVMTFTGREDDVDRIKGVCFGVTAPDPLRAAASMSSATAQLANRSAGESSLACCAAASACS